MKEPKQSVSQIASKIFYLSAVFRLQAYRLPSRFARIAYVLFYHKDTKIIDALSNYILL